MTATNTDTSTFADQAFAFLRDEIILFRLKPGEIVSENLIKRRYDLATASVRSALVRLTQEGLIRRKHENSKYRIIAPLSLNDIRDVFLVRRQLEPLAAKLAAGQICKEKIAILDDACRAGYTPGNVKEELRFLNANSQFHLAIAEASGSVRIARIIRQLHSETNRILYLGFQLRNRSDEWSHGHETLLNALTKPDGDEAARISLELLDHSFEQITKATLNSPNIHEVSLY